MLTLQYGRLTGGGLDDELKRRAKLAAGREEVYISLVSPAHYGSEQQLTTARWWTSSSLESEDSPVMP